jgi:nicotinamidase-related amidase
LNRASSLPASKTPDDDDYFVIKPQFSGFYATNLQVLLPKLGVRRLILTGIAADICVLFTAADAHMRAYDLWIPRDAVASEDDRRADWALDIMRNSMEAETRATTDISLQTWLQTAKAAPAECGSGALHAVAPVA